MRLPSSYLRRILPYWEGRKGGLWGLSAVHRWGPVKEWLQRFTQIWSPQCGLLTLTEFGGWVLTMVTLEGISVDRCPPPQTPWYWEDILESWFWKKNGNPKKDWGYVSLEFGTISSQKKNKVKFGKESCFFSRTLVEGVMHVHSIAEKVDNVRKILFTLSWWAKEIS